MIRKTMGLTLSFVFCSIAWIFLVITFFIIAGTASGKEARLFSEASPHPIKDLQIERYDPGVIRVRYVKVNFDPLQRSTDAERPPKELIILNLFDDVTFSAVMDRIEKRSIGNYTWFGHIDGISLSNVILVIEGSVMVGNITTPGRIYQVRFLTDGIHIIREIDQSVFPSEAEPLIPLIDSLNLQDVISPMADDDGYFIDVMVVYSPQTRAAAGGTSNILAEIQLGINETNQSYLNSGIRQRVRLVKTVEAVGYIETGSDYLGNALNCITETSDGCLDWVHDLRTIAGADLVSFWIENGGGYCGLGWMMDPVSSSFAPHGFTAVARSCATGYYSFGHEMGHNMGARHDIYVDTKTTPYPYAHGYVYLPSRWRTIMAYNKQCEETPPGTYCQRLPYWSNPSILYGSVPMGNDTADNQQTLDNTGYTVSNFRQVRFPALGVFRNGNWHLDRSGNGSWDGSLDRTYSFGMAGDQIAIGDWNGDGDDDIGVFRNGIWYLDNNDNKSWSGCGVDGCYGFGTTGDLAIVGRWAGGSKKIGIFRNGNWYLDLNGNKTWNGCAVDACYSFGKSGDIPIVLDWNCDGHDHIGVFRNGNWYIDANGNGRWDGCLVDVCTSFGMAGDLPVVGDWNMDGCVDIGVLRNGMWYLDFDGNGTWSGCGTTPDKDRCYAFGMAGDKPAIGTW